MSDALERRFSRPADAVAQAPGRVLVLGDDAAEHGGAVLAATVPAHVTAELALRDDEDVVIHADAGAIAVVTGVRRVLHDAGIRTGGFELIVSGPLLHDASLAGDSALAVAVLRVLRKALRLEIDDVEVGLFAERAVHGEPRDDGVTGAEGTHAHLVDALVCSLGIADSLLMLDLRTFAHRRQSFGKAADLVVVDGALDPADLALDDDARRRECDEAAALLDAPHLCDIDGERLARLDGLPQPLGPRARHVISEHRRVQEAWLAVEHGEAERVGRILDASHLSRRQDFAAVDPELDTLVTQIAAAGEVYGARQTRAGQLVALARRGVGRAVAERLCRARSGARVVAPHASELAPSLASPLA